MKRFVTAMTSLALGAVILTGCGAKENTVHSVDDLKGKTIGVQLGTTGDTLAGDIEKPTVE